MSEKRGWKELPAGGLIVEPGNAEEYLTGHWRSMRPVWDEDKCIGCLTCWIHCPEGAVIVEDGEMKGIDYEHCKGCGICARECPEKAQAVTMVEEDNA